MEGVLGKAAAAVLRRGLLGFWNCEPIFGGCRLGGRRGLILSTIFLTVLTVSDSTQAESRVECQKRIQALVHGHALLEEKGSSFFVPAKVLQANPILLRNLIAMVYNHPFLTSFFHGFHEAPLSIHYLEKAYELPNEIMRMDHESSYSYDELIRLLKNLGAEKGVFDLDILKAEREGVYLRFLDSDSRRERQTDVEKRLRRQFAEAFVKRTASHGFPLPFKSFRHLRAGSSFMIEPAFFLNLASDGVKDLVVDELALSSWKPYYQSFQKRFESSKVSVSLDESHKVDIFLLRRKAHPTDSKLYLYEVSLSSESVHHFSGELFIDGQRVEWHESDMNAKLGIVALPEIGSRKNLELEIRTIGKGRFVQTVEIESY